MDSILKIIDILEKSADKTEISNKFKIMMQSIPAANDPLGLRFLEKQFSFVTSLSEKLNSSNDMNKTLVLETLQKKSQIFSLFDSFKYKLKLIQIVKDLSVSGDLNIRIEGDYYKLLYDFFDKILEICQNVPDGSYEFGKYFKLLKDYIENNRINIELNKKQIDCLRLNAEIENEPFQKILFYKNALSIG